MSILGAIISKKESDKSVKKRKIILRPNPKIVRWHSGILAEAQLLMKNKKGKT